MVTILDTGILQTFDFVFPVLLVFTMIFAVLHKTKALGDSTSINAIVAVAVSFMVLLSRTLIDMINFIIPWFVIAIIFFILLLLIFQVFGAKEEDIFGYMKKDRSVGWVIVGIFLLIVLAGVGKVLGQGIGPYLDNTQNETAITGDGGVATGSFQENLTATLFHPKILGLVILFIIMIFAIILLTGPPLSVG